MQDTKKIPFKITGMDGLGQGVSKETDKITFIPKTAPGDAGEATVVSEAKGVIFASASSFTHNSSLRVEPICPHFKACPSCHYLHIDYAQELRFKEESLARLFRKLPIPAIVVTPAIRRLEYRNRIQLHYNKNQKKLGMLDARNRQIVPIPDCLVAIGPIKETLKKLYASDAWMKEAPGNEGHVEIYWINEEIKVSWNRPYAEGGFTQVFQEMNDLLKNFIQDWNHKTNPSDIVDLFAGSGNLTNGLKYTNRLCIDYYTKNVEEDAISVDLYSKSALLRVKQEVAKRKIIPTQLLLDPPRSGFKDLSLWLEAFKPSHVAYVSCDPNTLARDISSVNGYQITGIHLIDFFPSTYHYETLIILERK